MKNNALILLLLLIISSTFGQEVPKVMFDHIFLLMDVKDINAITNSEFIKNKLVTFHAEDKVIANGVRTKGIYLDGVDNMVEIMDSFAIKPLRFFDSVHFNSTIGRSGLVFSVEKLDELDQLKSMLRRYQFKKYELTITEDGKKIPWFTKLNAADSVFYRESFVYYMILKYRKGNELKKEAFNKDLTDTINSKIIKRFSGVTLRLNDYERNYFTALFDAFAFHKVNNNQYKSPDGFFYTFKKRDPIAINSIELIDFETNFMVQKQTVKISDKVVVTMEGNKGYFQFN